MANLGVYLSIFCSCENNIKESHQMQKEMIEKAMTNMCEILCGRDEFNWERTRKLKLFKGSRHHLSCSSFRAKKGKHHIHTNINTDDAPAVTNKLQNYNVFMSVEH